MPESSLIVIVHVLDNCVVVVHHFAKGDGRQHTLQNGLRALAVQLMESQLMYVYHCV